MKMWGDFNLAKNFGTFKAEANDLLHFFRKCLEDPKIVKFQKCEIPEIRGRISNGIEIPVRKFMYGFFLRGCPLFEKNLETLSHTPIDIDRNTNQNCWRRILPARSFSEYKKCVHFHMRRFVWRLVPIKVFYGQIHEFQMLDD